MVREDHFMAIHLDDFQVILGMEFSNTALIYDHPAPLKLTLHLG